MEIDYHNVECIEIEMCDYLNLHNPFYTKTITVTNKDGHKMKLVLYTNEKEKLNAIYRTPKVIQKET